MSNFILITLIGHFLGDYYLQSEKLAGIKNKEYSKLMLHSILYFIVMVVVVMFIDSKESKLYATILGSLHFVVDIIKFWVLKLKTSPNIRLSNRISDLDKHGSIYIWDQLIHLFMIVGMGYYYTEVMAYSNRIVFNSFIDIDYNQVLRIILIFLILLKPTNITFKMIFGNLRPILAEGQNFVSEGSVGRLIGNLERVLIFMLLVAGQYGSIGLVFTAKSITRYNKIVEDKKFGEYYLLGTLYSLLVVLIVFTCLY